MEDFNKINLNTSNVNVNLVPVKNNLKLLWDLNTSNVNVNPTWLLISSFGKANLNTSNVNVNQL